MRRILTIAHVVWLDILRRKDVYVVMGLLVVLLTLVMSLDIFGLENVSGHIRESGLLATWVFSWILAVNIGSRLLPEEESRGTVFSLLARPVTRVQLVVGKWIGCWTVVSACSVVFYLVVTAFAAMHRSVFCASSLLQALSLHLCMLGILSAVGMAFSTRLNRDAAATITYIISLSSFFLLPRIPHLAAGVTERGLLILYYALPHFELFDMRMRVVHGWGPVQMSAFLSVLLYGALMTTVFLSLGCIGYQGRRFSRGSTQ